MSDLAGESLDLIEANLSTADFYAASPVKTKRRRATKVEMEERASFLIDYASLHGPISVRGLYYQAEVAEVPGIDKTEDGYNKVQRQVLNLRRAGRLDYEHIADATRWMRKPRSYDSIEDALKETARTYRRNLWLSSNDYVEIWCEKDALASVISPITELYDVPLMVARGFSSESYAYEAIAQRGNSTKDYYVYHAGDFDRAGQDAARDVKAKLERLAKEMGCRFRIIFEQIAVTEEQIAQWGLPTRDPKRESAADKNWPHARACELDSIPPDTLRDLVQGVIERHLPKDQLDILKAAEESERTIIRRLVIGYSGDADQEVEIVENEEPQTKELEAETLEWAIYQLHLIQIGATLDYSSHTVEELRSEGWRVTRDSPAGDQWFGDGGDSYRKARWAREVPQKTKDDWFAFYEANRHRTVADVEDEILRIARDGDDA